MVLFLLRSAGSPWNLLRCGRRWTTSSSADCACQMQQPKALVFRQLIFGITANPHYKSFRSLRLRLGVAALRLFCGLWYVFCRSSSGSGFFAPISLAFFLLYLKYAWARFVCLRTPVGLIVSARQNVALSCVDTSLAFGTLRAGYVSIEALRHTPGNPTARFAQPHRFAPSFLREGTASPA